MRISAGLIVLLLATTASGKAIVETFTVGDKPLVVVRPEGPGPWPVVYALPGLGEMKRGPRISSHGWVTHYGLREAMNAVLRGNVTSKDLQGLVKGDTLKPYRDRAARFKGLVIVCPATPVKLKASFRTYLIDTVIPWAERTLPIRRGPAFRGIDGISLGGRHALRIGLARPELFKAIGTEQAAARGLSSLANRLVRARPAAFAHLKVGLITSKHDGFREPVRKLNRTLTRLGVSTYFTVTPGRHDKRFARGPGAVEMLLFHDTALNRRSSQPRR